MVDVLTDLDKLLEAILGSGLNLEYLNNKLGLVKTVDEILLGDNFT